MPPYVFNGLTNLDELFARAKEADLEVVGNMKLSKLWIDTVLAIKDCFGLFHLEDTRPKQYPAQGVVFFFGGQLYQQCTLSTCQLLELISNNHEHFSTVLQDLDKLAEVILAEWDKTTVVQKSKAAA